MSTVSAAPLNTTSLGYRLLAARRLRELREASGFPLEEWAALLAVQAGEAFTLAQYQRYEAGSEPFYVHVNCAARELAGFPALPLTETEAAHRLKAVIDVLAQKEIA